jgi:hypothetical protein
VRIETSRRSLRSCCASLSSPFTLVLTVVLALWLVRPAQAQLLVGVDDPLEPIWAVDVVSNQATPVLTGFGASAMAVDGVTNTLYIMTNTVTLYRWNLNTPAVPPTLVGTTTSGGSNISITGLAFDNSTGKLFGSRTLGDANRPEGFYEIDTVSAVASLRYSIATQSNGNSPYDFGAFDYDPVSNRFYGISDPTTSGGGTPGFFNVDIVNQQLNLVAPLPATADGIQDIDGLAVGGGRAYMVEDRSVQTGGRVHVYNLLTNQYEAPLMTPWFFNETFAGATYIPNFGNFMSQVPEPSMAAVLLLMGGGLAARRRRASR